MNPVNEEIHSRRKRLFKMATTIPGSKSGTAQLRSRPPGVVIRSRSDRSAVTRIDDHTALGVKVRRLPCRAGDKLLTAIRRQLPDS